MSGKGEIDSLVDRVIAAEPTAVAQAISWIEDRRPSAESKVIPLLRALAKRKSPLLCHRIGITGPPGVGKSSLVSALARTQRRRGRTVGVLAVDPSSPRSGGALLGDRARIDIDPSDTGLFVRSMASGGDLGGLTRAAGGAIDVLSSAYDVVMIETTGVGQSETDVEHVADTVTVVIQPGSGDLLQFLKAGIIEIPDLFVVNKTDLGDIAQHAVAELGAALNAIHAGAEGPPPALVSTSALRSRGIDELVERLDAHRQQVADDLAERRDRKASAWALRLFARRYGDHGVEKVGGSAALESRLRHAIAQGATAVEVVAAEGAPLG